MSNNKKLTCNIHENMPIDFICLSEKCDQKLKDPLNYELNNLLTKYDIVKKRVSTNNHYSQEQNKVIYEIFNEKIGNLMQEISKKREQQQQLKQNIQQQQRFLACSKCLIDVHFSHKNELMFIQDIIQSKNQNVISSNLIQQKKLKKIDNFLEQFEKFSFESLKNADKMNETELKQVQLLKEFSEKQIQEKKLSFKNQIAKLKANYQKGQQISEITSGSKNDDQKDIKKVSFLQQITQNLNQFAKKKIDRQKFEIMLKNNLKKLKLLKKQEGKNPQNKNSTTVKIDQEKFKENRKDIAKIINNFAINFYSSKLEKTLQFVFIDDFVDINEDNLYDFDVNQQTETIKLAQKSNKTHIFSKIPLVKNKQGELNFNFTISNFKYDNEENNYPETHKDEAIFNENPEENDGFQGGFGNNNRFRGGGGFGGFGFGQQNSGQDYDLNIIPDKELASKDVFIQFTIKVVDKKCIKPLFQSNNLFGQNAAYEYKQQGHMVDYCNFILCLGNSNVDNYQLFRLAAKKNLSLSLEFKDQQFVIQNQKLENHQYTPQFTQQTNNHLSTEEKEYFIEFVAENCSLDFSYELKQPNCQTADYNSQNNNRNSNDKVREQKQQLYKAFFEISQDQIEAYKKLESTQFSKKYQKQQQKDQALFGFQNNKFTSDKSNYIQAYPFYLQFEFKNFKSSIKIRHYKLKVKQLVKMMKDQLLDEYYSQHQYLDQKDQRFDLKDLELENACALKLFKKNDGQIMKPQSLKFEEKLIEYKELFETGSCFLYNKQVFINPEIYLELELN